MRNKFIILAVVLMSITSIFTGCGNEDASEDQGQVVELDEALSDEDSKYGGSLVVATKGSPPHLDSDSSTMWTIGETMNHVYEGLFEFDENQVAQPFLVESYELTNDDKTYDIKLREGVLFHNGKEMTSEDVEASFNRWISMNAGGQMVGEFLEDVRVKGPYGISFTFKEPYAPFINIMASEVSSQKLYIRTKEMADKYKDKVMTEHIGTGVYKLEEFLPDQYLKLRRFDDYVAREDETSLFAGKRAAYIDDITFNYIQDPTVRVAGIQTGEVQFAEEIPQDQYPMFANDPNIDKVDLTDDIMGILAINLGRKPFNDINARKALIHSLDMEELARVAIGDEDFWSVDEGGSLFPKSSFWYVEDSGEGIHNKQDIELAKEYLAKANYDGEPVVIVNSKDVVVESQAATGLKTQLEKVGFNVELQLYDIATAADKVRGENPDWDLNFSDWVEANPDPQVFGAWIGTNRWISGWDDEDSRKMDEIFDRMLIETDPEKRHQIVEEWNAEVWEQLPIIKTFTYTRVHLKRDELKGYNNYPKLTFFNTWLEE